MGGHDRVGLTVCCEWVGGHDRVGLTVCCEWVGGHYCLFGVVFGTVSLIQISDACKLWNGPPHTV